MHIDNVRPERAGSAGEVKRSEAADAAVRAPQPAQPANRADRVEISEAGRELAMQQMKDGNRAGRLSPERLATLRQRVEDGYYDSAEVIDRTARRILDSGEVSRASGGGQA